MPARLPLNFQLSKNLFQTLRAIYGIGRQSTLRVCDDLGLCPRTPYKDCTALIQDRIEFYIQENFFTEKDYRIMVLKDIANYREISCYKGIRHSQKLPCRGQRTHGNAKTARKSQKGVG